MLVGMTCCDAVGVPVFMMAVINFFLFFCDVITANTGLKKNIRQTKTIRFDINVEAYH